ncbi:MAG TPA: hypothetical protein VMM13_14215 [Euzebya sp.]|nr:hypothetical protein [Euzebya sp.]
MNVVTSAPPAGIEPIGKPIAVPRNHGFHERCHSSRVIHTLPRAGTISSSSWRRRAPTYSASPTANSLTATTTMSRPSNSSAIPKVRRLDPLITSMPISPTPRPRNRLSMPRISDRPSSAATLVKASTMRAK